MSDIELKIETDKPWKRTIEMRDNTIKVHNHDGTTINYNIKHSGRLILSFVGTPKSSTN